MNGWQNRITDRQHEAALRYHCGEPIPSIARAMGLRRASAVQNLLSRFKARGGELRRRGPHPNRHPLSKQSRNAAILARIPSEPMPSLAKEFGISLQRVEQIVTAHERETGSIVVRYRQARAALLQGQRENRRAKRQEKARQRETEALKRLERVARCRESGMSATDICAAEGVHTDWPGQMVQRWLHEWERRTGRKRHPGKNGGRPRRLA